MSNKQTYLGKLSICNQHLPLEVAVQVLISAKKHNVLCIDMI